LRRLLVFCVIAAAVAGGGYYYFRVYAPAQEAKLAAARRTPPAAPVTVAKVQETAVPMTIGTIGNAQPYSTVAIKSRVDGQIFTVGFQEGQLVKKGDLLFVIDPRPFEAQLQQAQATLNRDQAQLVRANLDLKRYAELAQKSFAPQQQLEQARATAESAAATIQADQAALAQAKLNLEYTKIYSPIDTVSMVVINQIKPIYVSFAIPEQDLPEVKRRMAAGELPVEVTIPGDSGQPAQGRVTFINNTVDTATGTIQLKATFANADSRLTPGQFVNVRMTLTTLTAAIVVPTEAVQTGQQGNYVFVLKPDGTVEQRSIQLGPTLDTRSIVEKGLAAGEQVVTEGQLRLYPGAKVAVKGTA
jgi:multidrug efflux system membrane fusion protein